MKALEMCRLKMLLQLDMGTAMPLRTGEYLVLLLADLGVLRRRGSLFNLMIP